jgi:hypothetical protein
MKIHSRLLRIVLLGLIVMFTMSCTIDGQIPGDNQNSSEKLQALQQTQIALSVEQTVQALGQASPVPSVEASSEIALVPPTPEPTDENICLGKIPVSFQGISFCYPPEIVNTVSGTLEPEIFSEMSENFNEPQRFSFVFSGNVFAPTFHTPIIQIYPVQEYININPHSVEKINMLNTFLQTQPANPESMPFLPTWNAAQIVYLQVDYLTFQNGAGVRYLSQYGQSFWPINNHDLFYTFQGLTNDGQYYISAVFPISHPSLPVDGQAYSGDINAFGLGEGENFTNYLAGIKAQIDSQADESFTPSLTRLDAIIGSLSILP